MLKTKCLRCNYDEFKASLTIHHIDGHHDNNIDTNLMCLCYNCHMGYHAHFWVLESLGIKTPDNYQESRRKPKGKLSIKRTQNEICEEIRKAIEKTDKMRPYL